MRLFRAHSAEKSSAKGPSEVLREFETEIFRRQKEVRAQRELRVEKELRARKKKALDLGRQGESQEVEMPIRGEKARDSTSLRTLSRPEESVKAVVPFGEQDKRICSCWFRTLGGDIGQELPGVTKLLPPPPGGERQRIAHSADTVDRHLKELYQPLKSWQTRVVTVLPGRDNELLQCTLWAADMIDKPGVAVSGTSDIVTYDALSYSWGTDTKARYIHINQLEVSVNTNLVSALADLRHERVQRNVWCDAICINQSDLVEKGQQVRNMLRIFEKAEHVIAWIGLPDLWTRPLFRALTDDNHASPDPTLRPYGAMDAKWRHNRECSIYLSRIVTAASEHLQRPWFRRTWVRQEVFGTSELAIYCGGNVIGLPEFITAIQWIQDFEQRLSAALNMPWELPSPIAASVFVLQNTYQHAGTDRHDYEPPRPRLRYSAHWLRVLNEGADFEVTDPRDKVYGVLGIITSPTTKLYVESRPDIRSSEFPINYTKSVSEVYQDVVKHLINLDRNLDVLQVFEDRRNRAKDLPSWVTDWRQNKKRSVIQCPPDSKLEREYVQQAPIQDLNDVGKLRLKGRLVGVLKVVNTASEGRSREELNQPEPERMDSNYNEMRSSGGFVWGTFGMGMTNSIIETRALVPRVAKLDDISVALFGGAPRFLLRPRPHGEYKFLGPVIGTRSDAQHADFTPWESGATVQCLIEHYDAQKRLTYDSVQDRQHLYHWLMFQMSGQGLYHGQCGWFNVLYPKKSPSAMDIYSKEVKRILGKLEKCLAGRQWLVGNKCTFAGLSFVTWNDRMDIVLGVRDSKPLKDFHNMEAWHDRVIARDLFKKAMSTRERLMDDQGLMLNGVNNVAENEANMVWEGDASA